MATPATQPTKHPAEKGAKDAPTPLANPPIVMQAKYVSGEPHTIPYTATADIAMGEVVVVGGMACIAHLAIKNGDTGALAAGGGVYEVAAAGGLAAGATYWDDAGNAATATASGNSALGVNLAAVGAGAGNVARIFHKP